MTQSPLLRLFRPISRASLQRGISGPGARRYRPRVEPLEDRFLLSTFPVTSFNDSGPGSLRDAIMKVNADPSSSLDTIDFKLPPTAPPTINLISNLPVITHQVFIDGSTQFGFMGSPIVELNGSAVPGGTGLVIRATGAVSPFVGAIKALKIDNFVVGIRISDAGSSTPASITLVNNSIVAAPGGKGIVLLAGTNATTAQITSNSITTAGSGDGIDVLSGGTTDKLAFSGNTIHASGGGAGIRAQGSATSTFLTFITNQVFTTSGGDAVVLQLSTSSKTTVRVQSNILHTNSMGVGLLLQGGPMFQAVVQTNDFNNNRVGVAVIGDGATAGNVDLGGGSLGSTGGNNFKSFLAATPTSYAIGLFHVAAGYSMDAKMNLFTPPPPMVIADGSHDTAAGGSGAILT
jgi:hypothetical protein